MIRLKTLRKLGLGIFGTSNMNKWNVPNKYFIAQRGKKFEGATLKKDERFQIYYHQKKKVLIIYPHREYKPIRPIVYEIPG